MKKYCRLCHTSLPRTAFGVNKKLWDGLASWCLACTRDYYRQRYAREAWAKALASVPRRMDMGH